MTDPVAYHSELATSWSARYSQASFQSRLRVFTRAIEQYSAPGGHWLDAGCGTGDLSLLLQDLGRQVTAVDGSPEMVRRCKVPAQVARVEKLPFADASFDGILCSSVVEYLESPAAVLQEFHRVLKANSCLLISVANARSVLRLAQQVSYRLIGQPKYMKYSRQAFTAKDFERSLRGEGFLPRYSEPFGWHIPGSHLIPFGYALRLHVATRQ